MVPVGFSGVAFDLPWKIGSRRNHNGKVANSPASSYLAYYRSHIRPSVLKVLVHYLSSTRSRCSTIHFAVPLGGGSRLFPLPCHQSHQRGRELARIGANEFVGADRDGLWPLGVVAQHQGW